MFVFFICLAQLVSWTTENLTAWDWEYISTVQLPIMPVAAEETKLSNDWRKGITGKMHKFDKNPFYRNKIISKIGIENKGGLTPFGHLVIYRIK